MSKSETVRTTIRVPRPLWDAAKHVAIDEQISLQNLVIQALKKYTAGKGKK